LLTLGEGRGRGEFQEADEAFVVNDRDEEKAAGEDAAEAGGDVERVIFIGADGDGATFEGGLADETFAESVGGGLVRGVGGVGANAAKVDGRRVVGEIEAAVEERNALGEAGEEAIGEDREVVGRLEAERGRGGFRLKPGLRLALAGSLLEGAERAGDLADLVGAIDEGDFGFELAIGEGLDGVADGPEFADNVDVEEVGGESKGDDDTKNDEEPGAADNDVGFGGEFVTLPAYIRRS